MRRRLRVVRRLGLLIVLLSFAIGCDEAVEPAPEYKGTLKNMASDPEQGESSVRSDEVEPNNDPSQAQPISWEGENITLHGVLEGGAADVDVFDLSVKDGTKAFGVVLTPRHGDAILGVSSADGRVAWVDEAGFVGKRARGAEEIPNVDLTNGLIFVRGRADQDLQYTLQIVGVSAETRVELEPFQDTPISASETLTGYANWGGDTDRFILGAGGNDTSNPLTIQFLPPGTVPMQLTLRHKGSTVWETLVQDGNPATFSGLRPQADGYELTIETIGAIAGPRAYQIGLAQTEGTGPSELEPNDTLADAQSLVVGTLNGRFQNPEDVDVYRLSLEAPNGPKILKLSARPSADLDIIADLHFVDDTVKLTRDVPRGGAAETLCNSVVRDRTTIELTLRGKTVETLAEDPDGTLPPGPAAYVIQTELRDATGEELEPNDERMNPSSFFELGTPDAAMGAKGYIHPVGDVDTYVFTVPPLLSDPNARATITVALGSGYRANLKLDVLDTTGAPVATADKKGFGEGERVKATLPAGDYIVQVRSNGGASCAQPYEITYKIGKTYLDRLATDEAGSPPLELPIEPSPSDGSDGTNPSEGAEPKLDPSVQPGTKPSPNDGSTPSEDTPEAKHETPGTETPGADSESDPSGAASQEAKPKKGPSDDDGDDPPSALPPEILGDDGDGDPF